MPPKEQIEGSYRSGFFRCADQSHCAVEFKQRKISVEVVLAGSCVENEVEAAGKIQLVGDAQNERLAHHDTVGVSAVSDAAENLVLSVIGESGEVNAELLLAGEAIDALSAGTDHAADACRISFFEFFDRAAGF